MNTNVSNRTENAFGKTMLAVIAVLLLAVILVGGPVINQYDASEREEAASLTQYTATLKEAVAAEAASDEARQVAQAWENCAGLRTVRIDTFLFSMPKKVVPSRGDLDACEVNVSQLATARGFDAAATRATIQRLRVRQ